MSKFLPEMVRHGLLAALLTLVMIGQVIAQQPPPSPVSVATAEQRVISPTIWVAGEVISRNDAQLATEIDGRLLWVAEVGDEVAKGEVVARIDATLIKQALQEQQATVQREQARLAFLDQEVVRLTSLVKKRNVSQSQLDQTIADRAVARGDLAIAQAKVDQAAERLARSEIKAPFAGVVTERLLQAGEWADSSDAVVRLVDAASQEVRTWVTADVLPYLQKGMSLMLRAGEQHQQGTIATIVGVSGSQSRMYELRLTVVDNPWPVGVSLKVAVPTAEQRQAIVVPRDALVLRRGGTAVFRIKEDDSAERVSVTTGIAEGALIEVRGGIQSGDRVVTNGGERLRPGQMVKIINEGGN